MTFKLLVPALVMVGLLTITVFPRNQAEAGEAPSSWHYKVLTPIRHDNLTVFPVVAAATHDTQQFLTLDEGLRSGDVVVTEYGNVQGLIRRRPGHPTGTWEGRPPGSSAQVNNLVLVNNSKRPLILLAGEIVTGGKQDRVIGKDRLVPAESDPVDLSVFCVEPGRWTGVSEKFNTNASPAPMAQPTVRGKAMADKDQAKVWEEVARARQSMSVEVTAAAPEIATNSSYAGALGGKAVKEKVDSVAAPLEREYKSLIQQLREQKAVGVVVAVNGEIIWADIFASTDLLEKYWPKLARSYAAEAIVTRAKSHEADEKSAQAFLDDMEGRHQTVDSEPGLYRHTEISGDGFKAFELTSLLPKSLFDLHVAKMAE